MVKLFDRVKVNIATTGVGDITFGSAASDAFLTPTEAGCADADEVRYVIVDGTDYEEGIGTIKSSVAEMERTTVTKSKISGTAGTTKINLSGTAVLALVASAADILTPDDNLASLEDADEALDNLGGTTVGKAVFKAADAAAAQDAIGATSVGKDLLTAVDADDARAAVGIGARPVAWVKFAGASGAIDASYNVSGVTRNDVGDYTISFTDAMPDANYAVSITGKQDSSVSIGYCIAGIMRTVGAQAAGSVRIGTVGSSFGGVDYESVMVVVTR